MKIAGRYEPTGTSTTGGMGEIIECLDSHLQRRVIIKRLQDGVEERRLIDEQRALAKLRSKHVVQLYDVVELTDRRKTEPAIVLEFIEGDDLELNSFALDHAYLSVLWQIACGLNDIHEAGVIHRDIKPNNVRKDNEGVIKIIDFGLSRSTTNAKTIGLIGTPTFMAPELWSSTTISFDRSIDTYAFGVTALTLVSDNLPKSLAKQPPEEVPLATLSATLSGLPSDVISMIHRCLSSTPTKRPIMANVQALLARNLLKNKHRALVVMNGQAHHLDRNNRKITLTAGNVGSLTIEYDGFDFKVSNATGAVFLNNTLAPAGTVVPGCSVITFGTHGQRRHFVTFDVSSPEVMP